MGIAELRQIVVFDCLVDHSLDEFCELIAEQTVLRLIDFFWDHCFELFLKHKKISSCNNQLCSV